MPDATAPSSRDLGLNILDPGPKTECPGSSGPGTGPCPRLCSSPGLCRGPCLGPGPGRGPASGPGPGPGPDPVPVPVPASVHGVTKMLQNMSDFFWRIYNFCYVLWCDQHFRNKIFFSQKNVSHIMSQRNSDFSMKYVFCIFSGVLLSMLSIGDICKQIFSSHEENLSRKRDINATPFVPVPIQVPVQVPVPVPIPVPVPVPVSVPVVVPIPAPVPVPVPVPLPVPVLVPVLVPISVPVPVRPG